MPTTRRELLRHGLWATGALATLSLPMASRAATGPAIEPGLQLYTVRKLLEADFAGTLEEIAKIGFREVQVSPRAGKTPGEIRRLLDDNGLICPSIHLELRNTTQEEIEAAQALGAQYVFLSAPRQALRIEDGKFVGLRDDLTLDTWREIADGLNETGAEFQKAGLQFGYHNHAFEFPPIEGVVPFDLLCERTDPDAVALEIDLGWAQVGGADPLEYFARYPGRFPVCHVKDVLADGSFVDPGKGTVDFARAFSKAKQAGLRHFFVEHDTTQAPMATAAAGYEYLRTLELG